jgi:transcriptional regulator with XRE-family HTH domain
VAQVNDRVRMLRKERGLTQEEVARRAGLTLNSYGGIERGHVRDPHLSSLGAIAQALGVPIEALVSEELAVPLAEAPREAGPTTGLHEWAQAYSASLHGMSDAEWDAHVRGLESVDEIKQELRTLLKERENLRAAFDVNKGLNPEDRENRISRHQRLREIRTDRLADLASAATKKKNETLLRHAMEALLEEAHS